MKKKSKKEKNAFTPAFKDHIRRMASDLKKIFYVSEYYMNLCWCESSDDEDERGVAMSISHDTKYLNFTIHVKPMIMGMYERSDFEMIGRCIVHEFAHLLVDPVWDVAIKGASKERYDASNEIRERQVQRAANVIFDFLPVKVWQHKTKKDESHKPKRR